jgi:hypothetical protein
MTRHYQRDNNTGREYLAYVSPGDVRYTPEDISLLFPWLLEMREGVGPAEPGAEKAGGRSGNEDHAHYEAWCKVAAEIDLRLERTHEDRLITESFLKSLDENTRHLERPETLEEYDAAIGQIAKEIHRTPAYVKRAIQSVLSYIASGPCPRWLNCIDCLEHGRCAKKKYPPRKFTKAPVGKSYEEWKASRPGRRENKGEK